MKAKYKSGLVTMLDFETVEDSLDKEFPIYIYKDEGLIENNIVMTIEEAEWLIKELKKIINALKSEEEWKYEIFNWFSEFWVRFTRQW